MDETTYKRAVEQLFPRGWQFTEIRRLCRFHKNYVQTSMDQADFDYRHLDFIRWLVATGRLDR